METIIIIATFQFWYGLIHKVNTILKFFCFQPFIYLAYFTLKSYAIYISTNLYRNVWTQNKVLMYLLGMYPETKKIRDCKHQCVSLISFTMALTAGYT